MAQHQTPERKRTQDRDRQPERPRDPQDPRGSEGIGNQAGRREGPQGPGAPRGRDDMEGMRDETDLDEDRTSNR
jgi:hypothetical protein